MDLEKLCSPGRIRILRYLLEEGQANVTRIVRETGLHHKQVQHHMKVLEELGIVEERKYGRLRVYVANLTDPRIAALRDILRELDSL
ncbi:MAG: winged helix-turn-helix domain-containing protein [Desulfurococcales archaeon]|nr:winged helix-turn-helix domain-containing protein [Desulfurococcales archaeon]